MKTIFDMFDKLDDCVKVIVDATFGWSTTLQKKHLENIRTRNKKDLLETQARIEEEGKRLEAERKEREKQFQLEYEKEQNEERKKLLEKEQELHERDIAFKISQVQKLTQIVSGLQNEHSKKVMSLLVDYRAAQTEILKDLTQSYNENIRNITEEAKEFKIDYPEIYALKLKQIENEEDNHQKLVSEMTDGMQNDLSKIQAWLLDSSKFNAEEFILKISGSKEEAANFKKFLDSRNINPQLLEQNLSDTSDSEIEEN